LYDWLRTLPAGARVLDLASAGGSFTITGLVCSVIAVDEDPETFRAVPAPGHPRYARILARCQQIPVASASIDLVVCNHALEHFGELDEVIAEIGRVLKPAGRLFLSVPDGYGLCDALYRWLFEGGGHVNRFRRAELACSIESRLGLHLAQWQKLHSSFSYLHSILPLLDSPPPGLQPRLRRLARLPRFVITGSHRALYVATRLLDQLFGTGSSTYGWAFWFDHGKGPAVEKPAWRNVCLYCGAGQPPESTLPLPRLGWQCSTCTRRNPFRCG